MQVVVAYAWPCVLPWQGWALSGVAAVVVGLLVWRGVLRGSVVRRLGAGALALVVGAAGVAGGVSSTQWVSPDGPAVAVQVATAGESGVLVGLIPEVGWVHLVAADEDSWWFARDGGTVYRVDADAVRGRLRRGVDGGTGAPFEVLSMPSVVESWTADVVVPGGGRSMVVLMDTLHQMMGDVQATGPDDIKVCRSGSCDPVAVLRAANGDAYVKVVHPGKPSQLCACVPIVLAVGATPPTQNTHHQGSTP